MSMVASFVSRRGMNRNAMWLIFINALAGCGPSEESIKEKESRRHLYCLDHFCEGDVEPRIDQRVDSVFKRNGRYFIAPRECGGVERLAFHWPSKLPAGSASAGTSAVGADAGEGVSKRTFYDSAIEIFLFTELEERSGDSRFETLRKADLAGGVLEKKTVGPGLEEWVLGPGYSPDYLKWYVATSMKDEAGEPPVMSCLRGKGHPRCTYSLFWKPGIAAYVRFSADHAESWPAIYTEITRVLSMVKEA